MSKATDGNDAQHRGRARLRRSALFFGLASMAATVWATPEGLVPIAIGAIQRDAGPDYAVRGENARNDRQGWHVRFAARGVELRAAAGDRWTFALGLNRAGSASALIAVPAAGREISGNRVIYRRGVLDEWYLNGPLGLEQGFTVHRPMGDTLVLELGASWPAEVDGPGVRFVRGRERLHLGALHAFDAKHRVLPSRMRVVEGRAQIEVAAEGASYPLTIDPILTGPTTLTASDAGAFHWFGRSASLSRDGDTALIGAPVNGAAYVFVRRNGNWVQKQKLRPPTGLTCFAGRSSFFGASVALSADAKTALIGASGTINLGLVPFKFSCLEALVYVKSGNRWRLSNRLRGRGVRTDDLFGSAVALSATGTTALIGAESTEYPGSTEDCGAAYFFERETDGWRQRKRFLGSTPFAEDLGIDLALSADGKWALAGTTSNSVLAFQRNKRRWRMHSTISVADSRAGDSFGRALALSARGQRALIGAGGVECSLGINCGLAYTFVRQGGAWIEEDRLAPADVNQFYHFGDALALSRNGLRAIFGVSGADCPNGNCGAAYVFDRAGGDWVEKGRVTSPTAGLGGQFGESVATSGDGRIVLVGARLENCAAGQDCGAAYAYSRSD